MQTNDRKNFVKTQRRVLVVIAAIILFCAFCTLINNMSVLKNIEIENTFVDFDGILGENAPIEKLDLCDASANEYVRIGGKPIGISIKTQGLIVASKEKVLTASGESMPLKNCKIDAGDVLLGINGEKVNSLYKLKDILSNLDSPGVSIEYSHQKVHYSDRVVLAKDKNDGKFKLGLALKEDVGGVGTLTFVTTRGNFAALGHRISDVEGIFEELNEGNIYDARVSGVVKGERGKAGGLVADVNRLSKSIGEICANTEIGLYGRYNGEYDGKLYKIASKGEAHIGKAQVLTTIDGTEPKFYNVEIVKVVSQSEPAEKGMVVKVSDDELIEKTGGIVQGMSGSPIVQDGVLIGAITHVFVQDPTRGYAVHSRFMLEKAQSVKCSQNTCVEQGRIAA